MHYLVISIILQLVEAETTTSYNVYADRFVPGSVLESQPVDSRTQCATLCTDDANCGAANYDSISGICQLLAVDPSEVKMENKTGSSYICCSCSGATGLPATGFSKISLNIFSSLIFIIIKNNNEFMFIIELHTMTYQCVHSQDLRRSSIYIYVL